MNSSGGFNVPNSRYNNQVNMGYLNADGLATTTNSSSARAVESRALARHNHRAPDTNQHELNAKSRQACQSRA